MDMVEEIHLLALRAGRPSRLKHYFDLLAWTDDPATA